MVRCLRVALERLATTGGPGSPEKSMPGEIRSRVREERVFIGRLSQGATAAAGVGAAAAVSEEDGGRRLRFLYRRLGGGVEL